MRLPCFHWLNAWNCPPAHSVGESFGDDWKCLAGVYQRYHPLSLGRSSERFRSRANPLLSYQGLQQEYGGQYVCPFSSCIHQFLPSLLHLRLLEVLLLQRHQGMLPCLFWVNQFSTSAAALQFSLLLSMEVDPLTFGPLLLSQLFPLLPWL